MKRAGIVSIWGTSFFIFEWIAPDNQHVQFALNTLRDQSAKDEAPFSYHTHA